jgi:hypothetical protein
MQKFTLKTWGKTSTYSLLNLEFEGFFEAFSKKVVVFEGFCSRFFFKKLT